MKNIFFLLILSLSLFTSYSYANEGKLDPIHHVSDAHEFTILGKKVLNLPVILWTSKGLVVFSSGIFKGDDLGQNVVNRKGESFVKVHEKIYYYKNGLNIEDYKKEGRKPLDFSITKNVFSMFISIILLFIIFISSAKGYKNNGVPKGIASFMEPIILFVRDDIAIPNIGEKKYKKYMPFLLSIFFFIWINNIIGLIPFFPFGSNLTGNIAFTCTLALFTFIITNLSGNSNYWKHIFWTPGVPIPMKIFLMPVELLGVFTKPFSLMIRLFANITAGHIIVLSLIGMIFMFNSYWVAPVSVGFAVFITLIEFLIVAIQAYIFTVLSALYIGMASEEAH